MADYSDLVIPLSPPPPYSTSQPSSYPSPPQNVPLYGGPQLPHHVWRSEWPQGLQLQPLENDPHFQRGYQPQPANSLSQGYVPQTRFPPPAEQPDAEVIRYSLATSPIEAEPLIALIPGLSPPRLESIREYLLVNYRLSVEDLVPEGPLSGLFALSSFKDAVRAALLGPLGLDVWLLSRAMAGVKANVALLSMVLLDRKNSDLEAIKTAYRHQFERELWEDVRKKLHGDVKVLFTFALLAPRPSALPTPPSDDGRFLYGNVIERPDGWSVAKVLTARSYTHLLKVVRQFEDVSGGETLDSAIEKRFGGDMRDALLYILRGVTDRALRDAKLLEGTIESSRSIAPLRSTLSALTPSRHQKGRAKL